MSSEDGQFYSACILQFSTNVCKKKQIVNIADENLTNYSFLSRYHYTKLKNYLKRQYRIRYWISMFVGTPCIWRNSNEIVLKFKYKYFSNLFSWLVWGYNFIKQLLNIIYENPAEKAVENSNVKRFIINPVKSECFRRNN